MIDPDKQLIPVPKPSEEQKPETDKIREKFNARRIKCILDVLSNGGTRKDAYEFAGISKNCFYEWLKEIPDFKAQVENAEASSRVFAVNQLWTMVKAFSSPDIKYWLDRRHPEFKPKPNVVKQENHTHIHHHAEELKKARERVYARTGRRPGSTANKP